MRKVDVNVLSDVDTSTVTGGAIDSNQLISASFQAVFADTAAIGVVKIQASNDIYGDQYQPANFTPTNWSDIPNATSAITAGVGPIILIPVMSFRWVRVIYTRTSGGSTTVNVNMFAMGV